MTDRPAPTLTDRAELALAARRAREAAALRANLHRRKQQQRVAADGPAPLDGSALDGHGLDGCEAEVGLPRRARLR